MNKLRLRLEDLEVDGFATTPRDGRRGTVVGEQGTWVSLCTCQHYSCAPTCDYTCDDATCPACPTCPDTCAQTCELTCGDSECFETCVGGTCAGGGNTCWDSCGHTCYDTCAGWGSC